MTKSQNTKNEQLTEQWRKGELPYAEYYIKLAGGEYTNDVWDIGGWQSFNKKGDVVVEVLAPVPSYEEYEQLENWNRFTADYHALREAKEIAEYEKVELMEKVKQLKELLKEWVQFEIEENPNDFTVMSERMSGLANKTKEVLK